MESIYLDNNATTPLLPEVLDAMLPWLRDHYGNPSSMHHAGQQAAYAIETAREQVAAMLGARPSEIVFTSGGTESIALAIRGTLGTYPRKRHVVTTTVEHDAVLHLADRLEQEGVEVTRVPVDVQGRLDMEALRAAVRDDTAVVAVMYANNETGVLFPVAEVAAVAAQHGAVMFTDGTQVPGKLPLNLAELPVQLMSLSAHKFHGPKGVGALFVRRGTHLVAQQVGGGQERNLRAGTQNVAGIVGLGAAADQARLHVGEMPTRVALLRDRLETALCERCDARVNGDRTCRLPNTANVSFEALEGESVMLALSESGVYASSGSACASGSLEASHVIRAMGVEPRYAHGALRFSLSRLTTEREIDEAIRRVPPVIERLSSLSRATLRTSS